MADKLSVRKSYKDGCIALRISLKGGYTLKVDGSADLPTADARELAKAMIEECDKVDARVAAKAASEDRRRKWRDREVAAGRIKIMSLTEVFRS